MYTDYMDLLYIEFEGQEIMPTAMDVETYLRYIDSLGIKRFDDDIMVIDKIKKHKRGHNQRKHRSEDGCVASAYRARRTSSRS